MDNLQITYDNFFIGTSAVFKGCKTPKREPDYVSWKRNQEDEISSLYWYGEDKRGKYVIRWSDHWSYAVWNGEYREGCEWVASCRWKLKTSQKSYPFCDIGGEAGKCYLTKFKRIKWLPIFKH